MEVAAKRVVSINFSLENDKGELLDSSPTDTPLVYLHGADGILPALERGLEGKCKGDEFNVTITPDDGFGPREAGLIAQVPRENFPEGEEISVGMQLQAQNPESGETRTMIITAITSESVTVDGNHPLAGMTLCFAGTVHEVRDATPEELNEGRPL